MTSRERSTPTTLALVLGVTIVVSVGLELAGLPTAVLFGALVGGITHALTSSTPLALPAATFRTAQALIGAIIATLVSGSALSTLGSSWLSIVLVTLGTVAISLIAGRLLAVRHDVTPVTGAFALLAGGASGVVVVARELGADERVVTVVQYLRVLIVLLTLPLVTTLVFRPDSGLGALEQTATSLPVDLLFVALTVAAGLALSRVVPLPTASLLGPLLVGSVLAATGVLGDVAVPEPLQWLAYGVIGVQVGLRFTRDSIRSIARMLPAVIGIIVVMIVLTASMGALLAALTPIDSLTAYLATTPGGLFAVLATAADSGSDVGLVLSVQLLRVIVVLLSTPVLARVLGSRQGSDDVTR